MFGSFLLPISKTLSYLHLSSLTWSTYAVLSKTICPLTYLENWFLSNAGLVTYKGSFLGEYISDLIYFSQIKEFEMIVLFTSFIILNAIQYAIFFGKKFEKF